MNKASALLLPFLVAVGSAALPGCDRADSLRNDAYAYYGLGNTAPMRLQITYGKTGGLPTPATRTVVPGKREGDKQTFTLKNEGGTENEGDITLSLEPSGIYAMSSTKSRISPHSIELPGRLDVGTVWKDHTQMVDQKIDLQNELRVVGKERVATAGGTFDDALHVKSTGGGTYGGKPATLATESWYVRDLGPVKQIVTVTPKSGPEQVVTIEFAPPEKAPDAEGGDLGGAPPGGMLPGGPGGVPGDASSGGPAPTVPSGKPGMAGGKK